MSTKASYNSEERFEDALKALEMGKAEVTAELTADEPKPAKKTARKKKTALEEVEGQQQEYIARALIMTNRALGKAETLLKTVTASNTPSLLQATARVATAQADIAQLINAKPSQFKDPEAIEGRLLEALQKLS